MNYYFPFFYGEMVNCSFPFCDSEMMNSFFDGEMGKVGRVTEIFSHSKIFHSFKLIFKNIVGVHFCLSHSFRRNFLKNMTLPAPFRATCWPSDSCCGGADRSKFVRCVDRRDPEVHEVWIWGDDGITPEVHLTAQIDIEPWITRDFSTN